MYRLKGVALIAFIVAALTVAVMLLSKDESVLPVQNIESEHARVHQELNDVMMIAELGLDAQAKDLAHDPELSQAIGDVRDKLITTTPEDLKRQTTNAWNLPVVKRLIHWRQQRDASINQADANAANILKAETGAMLAQNPLENAWNKTPNLILAFASVPLKDNQLSSVLIAYGVNGSELRGGKRYDTELPILAEVSQSGKAAQGHFLFDGKMYIAALEPIVLDDKQVGTVVLGYEISREMIEGLKIMLPSYVDLMLVYSSPRFDQVSGGTNIRRNYTTASEGIKKRVETEKFYVNSNNPDTSNMLGYDQAVANQVYVNNSNSDEPLSFSRIRWMWDGTQETDVYIISNLKQANTGHAKLQLSVIVAGLIALIAGAVLMIIFINGILKNLQMIRKAVADAITTGESIDAKAMGLIMNEAPDALPPYIIQERADAADTSLESEWAGMMDFDDESNANADKESSEEELARLKEQADVEEATPLYAEYMRLRKENHIDTPMEFDVFLRRLQRNAAQIKEKYHCTNVSFQVHVVDGNVILKPKISKS